MLTDKADYADAANSFHNEIADTFKFTNGNDIVEASNVTLGSGDTLIDPSTGDDDKLNLNLTSNFVADKDIVISNIETINLFNNSAARSVDLSAADITGVKTINVLGNNKLSLNVSTLTDNVTINGGVANDTIISGEGDDTIIGGAGDNVYTGGKGADTFVVGSGSTDTITDLGNGADILNIAEGATATATVTGQFVASKSNYINDGTVEFIVAANGVLDLSKADDGNIEPISIIGAGAKVVGTAGDDSITLSADVAATIEGGKGDDTITLYNSAASGATVVFEKTAAANGEDTITNFTSTKDKLDLSAFVAKTGLATDLTSFDSKNYAYVSSATELKFADISNTATSKIAANEQYVVITGKNIYYVTTGSIDSNKQLESATIEKVGTISANALVEGDFI